MSQFQHHTNLYSKCGTLQVSSLNLSPTCWRKVSSSCWNLLLVMQCGFNFPCTSCIICYNAAQIAAIFDILLVFFFGLPWSLRFSSSWFISTFISIPYHLPISACLSVMPCNTASSLASNTRSGGRVRLRSTWPPAATLTSWRNKFKSRVSRSSRPLRYVEDINPDFWTAAGNLD